MPGGRGKGVLLGGSRSGQDRVALHVTAQSGGVAVSMQSTALDGYTPAGVSFVTPSQAGRSLTVPGIRIDDAAGAASLRIVNPNNSPVSVNISTFSEAGKKPLPGGEAVKVAPGAVLIPLFLGLSQLLSGIVSAARFLPDRSTFAVFTRAGGDALDPGPGMLVLLVWVVCLTAIAAWLFERRDVR